MQPDVAAALEHLVRRDPQSYGVGLRGQGPGVRIFKVRVQAGEPYRLGFRLQNLTG